MLNTPLSAVVGIRGESDIFKESSQAKGGPGGIVVRFPRALPQRSCAFQTLWSVDGVCGGQGVGGSGGGGNGPPAPAGSEPTAGERTKAGACTLMKI